MDRAAVMKIVNEQANDDGIWFVPATAAEAYLQQELRRLHEAIEGVTAEECGENVLAAIRAQERRS